MISCVISAHVSRYEHRRARRPWFLFDIFSSSYCPPAPRTVISSSDSGVSAALCMIMLVLRRAKRQQGEPLLWRSAPPDQNLFRVLTQTFRRTFNWTSLLILHQNTTSFGQETRLRVLLWSNSSKRFVKLHIIVCFVFSNDSVITDSSSTIYLCVGVKEELKYSCRNIYNDFLKATVRKNGSGAPSGRTVSLNSTRPWEWTSIWLLLPLL